MAGNAKRGEVAFEADGRRWTLQYTFDALCRMEAALDRGFAAICAELQDVATARLNTVRAVFWAGLVEHHPDLTIKQAGEMMLAMGGAGAVLIEISKALAVAFPDGEADAAQNPPQPDQNGTGPASTPSMLLSATNRSPSGG